jgi:6,7-dimethyl-8-ribityllumazine synthase
MASEIKNLSAVDKQLPDGSKFKIAIVVSDYYQEITDNLMKACLETFATQNVLAQNIFVEYAPGTYELPLACSHAFLHYKPDAVIAFGCVVKGDTDHDIYINQSVAHALQELSLKHQVPFLFGVLTPNNYQQALDRAGGKHGNKGVEVAAAALRMIALKKNLNIE